MKYQGVDTDHPHIVRALRKMARDGRSKEDAQRIVGMPYEVVDREYQRAKTSAKHESENP